MVFCALRCTFGDEMSNSYFEFKQFIVRQDRCAMKVGTDGTLLGAWADVPAGSRGDAGAGALRILDVGCGTGLIALMMAQRFPEAQVWGIDIDPEAVAQARENVEASPFADRIHVVEGDVRQFSDFGDFEDFEGFDAIVCNPPFFMNSLACPDNQRTTARHTVNLTYQDLMQATYRLLADEGVFSVVIPTDCRSSLEAEAHLAGFFPSRLCLVKTTPKKAPKRCLVEFRKHPASEFVSMEGVIESSPQTRSEWYQQLTNDFYIK